MGKLLPVNVAGHLKKSIHFPNGILVLNKPINITSNGFLSILKSLSVEKKLKLGHAGTLDSEAKGVLIVGVGKGTKQLALLTNLIKTYKTTIIFGNKTTTSNEAGDITTTFKPYSHINREMIDITINKHFMGEISQKAPVYSAIKKDGVRLSDLTRRGFTVEPPTRIVKIYHAKCTFLKLPIAEFEVRVSSGFYVRSFAEEFAEKLGTHAYCIEIDRIENGPYKLSDAISFDEITNENVNRNVEHCTNILNNTEVLEKTIGEKSKTISPTIIATKNN
ncbi:hypothetical protein DICPUDRAFT_160185 [Dictyostelium purpureum]|uniref:tRNA pseudouridine(55) synthase n=1 Tax=Dictyostelium purpureum TaxID=5786 RepID=F1A5V6_DICPU|nr:uncharacterized protein DICPUDRAFT_160185 [Dictyostelium purpureum]EGC28425.1 hypothetical protein DICPUDRAFT_160185 [Dictyostelium purpureum]|eukprot:XP_003295052.1 hypothetical protein DICPUDRAFT_160185 [Dictyostelium purpureum]